MITSCPFCGRGAFESKFVNLQLSGLYKSASISAERAYAMEKATDQLKAEIERLNRKRNRVRSVATRKALEGVCNLLKHYSVEKPIREK